MILLSNVLTFLALPTLLKTIRDGTKQKPKKKPKKKKKKKKEKAILHNGISVMVMKYII